MGGWVGRGCDDERRKAIVNKKDWWLTPQTSAPPPPPSHPPTKQTKAGFLEVEAGYIRRVYANRGQAATRRRTWVHARFERPVAVGSDG